jgi:hypothetical protein
MADFLSSSSRIISRIEDMVDQAAEVIHLLSPTFTTLPETFSTKLWEALRRGVKIFIIYREIRDTAEKQLVRLQHSRLIILQNSNLNTSAYFNEKEAILTSHRFFAAQEQSIEFGTYFKKSYAASMFAELHREFKTILIESMKMVIEDQKFIREEEVIARNIEVNENREREARLLKDEDPAGPMLTKLLTVKEKQTILLKIFKRECPDCTLKIEDAERIRLVGKGIVLALSTERVDLIFVHYSTLQAKMDEVKAFILSKHPDHKVWVQYNRINLKLEYEKDITEMFFTMREVVDAFNLIVA